MLTGSINHNLWLYTIPVGMLTEAILHANNARDITADAAAGTTTLATLIGFNSSKIVFGQGPGFNFTLEQAIELGLNSSCVL